MTLRAGFTIPGYAFPLNWNTSLGTALPAQIKAVGGTHAVLQTTYNVATQTSTSITSANAVPDAGITAMTRASLAAGLRVVLKPHVQPLDGSNQTNMVPGGFATKSAGVNNATYSHASTNLACPTASFDSTYIGRRVVTPTPGHLDEIPSGLSANAYGKAVPNWTTITAVTDSHNVTMSVVPAVGVSTTTGYVVIPNDAQAQLYFDNYRAILDHLIGLVVAEGVPVVELTVDVNTEHDAINILHDDKMRALVAYLRTTYPGITLVQGSPAVNGYNIVRCWDVFDYIGMTWYQNVQSSGGGESEPTIEGTYSGYMANLNNLSLAWGGKQIIFTEVGYRSVVTAGYLPAASSGGTASETDQSRCVQAMLNTVGRQAWFAGFHWWTWAHPQNSNPANEATSYGITNADGSKKLAARTYATILNPTYDRRVYDFSSSWLPNAMRTDTSAKREWVSDSNTDPKVTVGNTVATGDDWLVCSPAVPGSPTTYVPRVVGAYGSYIPDNTNTGIVWDRADLGTFNSPGTANITVTQDNVTFESLEIFGDILVQAKNLKIQNCAIRGPRDWKTNDGATIDCNNNACVNAWIRDCTYVPQLPQYYRDFVIGHEYTAERNRSIWANDHYGCYSKPGSNLNCNVKIYGCYLTDNVYWQGTTAQYPAQAVGAFNVTTAWGVNLGAKAGYPLKADGTHNDGIQMQGALGASFSTHFKGNHIRINDAEQLVPVGGSDSALHPLGWTEPWPQLGTQNCHKRRTYNTGTNLVRLPDGRFPTNGQCIILQQNTYQNSLQDTVVAEENWLDDGGYAFNLQALASTYTTMKAIVRNNKISNNFYNFSSSEATGGISLYPIRGDNKAGMLVQGINPTNTGNVWWGTGRYGADGVLLSEGTSTQHLGIVYDS